MTVGQRIKAARKNAGMTQAELSRIIGVSNQSTIAAWENGRRIPKCGVLRKIATTLEIDLLELIGEEEQRDFEVDNNDTKILLAVKNGPNGFRCVLGGVDISGVVQGLDIRYMGELAKVHLELNVPASYMHTCTDE